MILLYFLININLHSLPVWYTIAAPAISVESETQFAAAVEWSLSVYTLLLAVIWAMAFIDIFAYNHEREIIFFKNFQV